MDTPHSRWSFGLQDACAQDSKHTANNKRVCKEKAKSSDSWSISAHHCCCHRLGHDAYRILQIPSVVPGEILCVDHWESGPTSSICHQSARQSWRQAIRLVGVHLGAQEESHRAPVNPGALQLHWLGLSETLRLIQSVGSESCPLLFTVSSCSFGRVEQEREGDRAGVTQPGASPRGTSPRRESRLDRQEARCYVERRRG